MRVRDFQGWSQENFPDLPEVVRRAVEPIARQVDHLTQALRGRLTFADNFQAEVIELPLTHGVAQRVLSERVTSPLGVLLLWTELGTTDVQRVSWSLFSSSQTGSEIELLVEWDGVPSGLVSTRVLVVGG